MLAEARTILITHWNVYTTLRMVKTQTNKLLRTILLLASLHIAVAIGTWVALGISFGKELNNAFGIALVICGLVIVLDLVLAIRAFYTSKNPTARVLFAILIIMLVIPVI